MENEARILVIGGGGPTTESVKRMFAGRGEAVALTCIAHKAASSAMDLIPDNSNFIQQKMQGKRRVY